MTTHIPTRPSSTAPLKIAWRIKPRQYESDDQFKRLLDLFKTYRAVVDEIALFLGDADTWHAYEPLDSFTAKARRAGERIRQLKAEGFTNIGINIWPTFGSEDAPGGDIRPTLPFQPMIGCDGRVARSTACLNTPELNTYLRKRFSLAAEQHPDFIWIDDDCRMTHLGVPYPCFCNTCLALFDGGRWKRREDLVAALNAPENSELRRKRVEFNTVSLEWLVAGLTQAIHEVDAGIDVGWMTVGPTHTTYSGRYINRCGKVINGRRGRAGHGFYWDERPRELIFKMLEVGRQVREYPENIIDIQYEYEDHPCIALDKGVQIAADEVTGALISGCNGIAMNTMHIGAGSLEEQVPLLERFSAERPAWEALVQAGAGLPLVGLWAADTPLLMANRPVDERGWFDENDPMYNIAAPNQWLELGFAFTTDPASSCGTLLAGKIAAVFSDDELQHILTGAVFMDIHALQVFQQRGLGEFTGVEAGDEFGGVFERLTTHSLNGPYTGNERQTWFDTGWTLRPASAETQVLSELFQVDGTARGACLTAYSNRLGGRVVVMGYAPWLRLGRVCKMHQLRSLVDWATAGRMPLLLDRAVRVAPFVRMDRQGTRLAAVLLNNGFDPTGELNLTVKANLSEVRKVLPSGEQIPLPLRRVPGGVLVTLDNLPAWQTATLIGNQ